MSEWISVDERLPEIGTKVSVLVHYANSENEHEDELISPDEWNDRAWGCVSHWRPFLEPPK